MNAVQFMIKSIYDDRQFMQLVAIYFYSNSELLLRDMKCTAGAFPTANNKKTTPSILKGFVF